VGRLGSGPRVMGRLGSRVWVSASFQIFALIATRCPRWEVKLSCGKMSGGICPRGICLGGMFYTHRTFGADKAGRYV